jgi:hypothetical protein
MIDATVSCGRMRGLARPGRFQGCDARFAAFAAFAADAALCASCAERLIDAIGIAESLGTRPRAAGPRSGVDELMAPIV